MLSVRQVQTHIYTLFRMMKQTGYVFEVVHDGVVYEMHLRRTDKKPALTRPKRKKKSGQTVQQLDMTLCPECDSMQVSGICMNSRCPTNG